MVAQIPLDLLQQLEISSIGLRYLPEKFSSFALLPAKRLISNFLKCRELTTVTTFRWEHPMPCTD
ncbi:hypothetical protein CL655_03210 [bacterium]|nr:hypothetical protein [bacterium]